jgi:hypothetical protein
MTTGSVVVRIVIGTIGALMLLSGLALVIFGSQFVGGTVGLFGALWLIVPGAILLIAVLIETGRYRSQQAERAKLSPGPGGGESGPLEPRFTPTPEVFVDPTSDRRMRVYVDVSTGERRYVAEA